MGWLSFILQYIAHPRSVGAVAPSSRFLACEMVSSVDFAEAACIVEFGPGTGVFTERILKGRNPDTEVVIIERNADFCAVLGKRYAGVPGLHIVNGSAEGVGRYLAERGFERADYIVSGLPFASLPPQVSAGILSQAAKHLEPGGRFITFQYTLLKKGMINRYFKSIEISREWRNLPPAYVLSCRIV
jgi:phospholipid N-methyltransferase